MVVTSLRALLQLETEHDIHGFTDPAEAAKFMESNPVDVCVSDYLMPAIKVDRVRGLQLMHPL
jgi:DNA-binding NarL/FixJ family response regulator